MHSVVGGRKWRLEEDEEDGRRGSAADGRAKNERAACVAWRFSSRTRGALLISAKTNRGLSRPAGRHLSVRPSVRPPRQRFVTRRWCRWRVPAPKGAQQSHAGAQKRRGGKKRTWSCMSALLILMRSSNGQRNQIPAVMSYISVGKNRGGARGSDGPPTR